MPTTRKQSRRQAKRLLRWCRVNGDVDDDRARQAMNAILASRHRGYLALLGQFQRLLKLELARHSARVESAVPLVADLQAQVRKSLEATYGAGVTTAFVHNPALIGGMRIQIGSDVYDGSVRSRLAALERSLGIESLPRNTRTLG
jgi:F-type H+-transporting ATPase subunit delta